MDTESRTDRFAERLRTVLNSLYDPSVLRRSPLLSVFGLRQRGNAVVALRRTLVDGIESLRPDQSAPSGSRGWRIYQILRRRYTEQLPQVQVADDLGFSVRQLQREEKLARQVLAEHLLSAHDLEARLRDLAPEAPEPSDATPAQAVPVPSRQEELEWLRDSVPSEMVDVGELIRDVLRTIDALVKSAQTSVDSSWTINIPRVHSQPTILRQALLHVIATAIRWVPGGRIGFGADSTPETVRIHIRARPSASKTSFSQGSQGESLRMAGELLDLIGGTMEVRTAGPGPAEAQFSVSLPNRERQRVLVVDDNLDTLRLFERYLAGTDYRSVGISDPDSALSAAETASPRLVILDVMMPQTDGWKLLEKLREHPRTRQIPVIVCTILPDEELAFSLGAADFLRKPVSRNDLLATLDRQLNPPRKESG